MKSKHTSKAVFFKLSLFWSVPSVEHTSNKENYLVGRDKAPSHVFMYEHSTCLVYIIRLNSKAFYVIDSILYSHRQLSITCPTLSLLFVLVLGKLAYSFNSYNEMIFWLLRTFYVFKDMRQQLNMFV